MKKFIFDRSIERNFIDSLKKGKIILLFGARQVGKTTFIKNILDKQEKFGKKTLYLNCELDSTRLLFEKKEIFRFENVFFGKDVIVLDEAQKIPDVGTILKIIHDELPHIRIIATGSSAFDLADKTAEAMTGRNIDFFLFPLSFEEIVRFEPRGILDAEAKLEDILRFGSYPEIYSTKGENEKKERLEKLSSDYLYKDVLSFENLRKSSVIVELLKLLALGIGQEVSLQSLASRLGINRITVAKYIDILEKSFVIKILRPLSRNSYRSLSKKIKVYFWDLGIRNSIIHNHNTLNVRDDVGALWENFILIERMKKNQHDKRFVHSYFWRSYSGQEVDYIEEEGGTFQAFEYKWNPSKKKISIPTEFSEKYTKNISVIHKENFGEFLL